MLHSNATAASRDARSQHVTSNNSSTDLQAFLGLAARDPELLEAAVALQRNQLAIAERLLKARLRAQPVDVAAMRMLAEVAGRLARYSDAEKLLRRALALAPEFEAAQANLVTVLHRQSKFDEALRRADRLLEKQPDSPGNLALKAAVLVRTGGYDEALTIYKKILASYPDQPKLWVSYGHVLKTVGRLQDSIAAYRRAIAGANTLGDAWWSLANLKTVRFGADDLAAMRHALQTASQDTDRYHLHFALGKALEDAGDYAQSFEHYRQGNKMRRAELPYDADETARHLERSVRLLTRDKFATTPHGHPVPDPIFIVGLPRAGSTLVEQILASHSAVEGTMELPDIGSICAELSGRHIANAVEDGYLPRLLALTGQQLRELGQRYIDGTRVQRKTGRPYFVDKMPNNFAHIGLIHSILPNAKIVDVRRHPMANCFAAYKQHFARGQGFTYDLTDLGRYYRDYVALLRHYDEVLPGRIHRIVYEQLVANPEAEIRKLLAYCGLPFEATCVAFHENPRAVRTASSEQVRQPISSAAVDHWRHFEPWLGELARTLGDELVRYDSMFGASDRVPDVGGHDG